jgi:hypothetical protein
MQAIVAGQVWARLLRDTLKARKFPREPEASDSSTNALGLVAMGRVRPQRGIVAAGRVRTKSKTGEPRRAHPFRKLGKTKLSPAQPLDPIACAKLLLLHFGDLMLLLRTQVEASFEPRYLEIERTVPALQVVQTGRLHSFPPRESYEIEARWLELGELSIANQLMPLIMEVNIQTCSRGWDSGGPCLEARQKSPRLAHEKLGDLSTGEKPGLFQGLPRQWAGGKLKVRS